MEPAGIPFYLPKPLLIISKNFRYIEEAKVGLTQTAPIPGYFDNQANYADVNVRKNYTEQGQTGQVQPVVPTTIANTATVAGQVLHSDKEIPLAPNVAPKDGLTPETFYTYQIIFVPDLSQKYGLRIKGGVGEIRAAMNLVNGWQFTGLGPYYMKDSSTAQNILATGIMSRDILGGTGDLIKSLADFRKSAAQLAAQGGELPSEDVAKLYDRVKKIRDARSFDEWPLVIPNYAEIYIYEPVLNHMDGTVEWRLIAQHCFDRQYLRPTGGFELDLTDPRGGTAQRDRAPGTMDPQSALLEMAPKAGTPEHAMYNSAVEKAMGLPIGTLAGQTLTAQGATLAGPVPANLQNNVNIDMGRPHHGDKKGPLQRLFHQRPKTSVTEVIGHEAATQFGLRVPERFPIRDQNVSVERPADRTPAPTPSGQPNPAMTPGDIRPVPGSPP